MCLPHVKWHSFYPIKILKSFFFSGTRLKNVCFFLIPGPFVDKDFLVLFQTLIPVSDMDFCSAFHVNWWGGRAYGVEMTEITPNQSFEGSESANQFWRMGRSLAETIMESGGLDRGFVWGFFPVKLP